MKNTNTLTCKEFVKKYKGIEVKIYSSRDDGHYANGVVKGCEESKFKRNDDWIVLSNFIYSFDNKNIIPENSLGYNTFTFIPLFFDKDELQDLIKKLEL